MDKGRVKPLMLKAAPVTFACVIVRPAFPVLLTLIVCELEEPTVTLPRFALDGVRLSSACRPVPLTPTTVFVP